MLTMKLEKYIQKNKISKTRFAQDAKITRQTLYTLLAGGKPSYRTAKYIARATGNKVSFSDF